jgi:hypothetical protein
MAYSYDYDKKERLVRWEPMKIPVPSLQKQTELRIDDSTKPVYERPKEIQNKNDNSLSYTERIDSAPNDQTKFKTPNKYPPRKTETEEAVY